MVTLNIKPLSVNQCYTGKRFKTDKYRKYVTDVMLLLPNCEIPKPPYKVWFEFGFSSKASDIDNPTKNIVDILSQKYGFNDKLIYELHIKRFTVKKGNEFIRYKIKHVLDDE